jgi:hypothetical protein
MPAAEVAEAQLEGGAAVRTVAAPHGESVVLVLSPEDCASCDVDVARWLSPDRDPAVGVQVVLTRAPGEHERRRITLLRLPVAGTLAARGIASRAVPSPCVLRFADGRLADAACGPGLDDGAVAGGPRATAGLRLVDTLVLAERADAFVGRPTHIAVTSGRELFISDAFSRTVLHVHANGDVRGSIGRRGRGPGEFEAPSTVLVAAHDSLLFVADAARGGVIVRDLLSGAERAMLRMEGNRPTMTLVGDTVFAGTVNATRGTVLARWTTRGDSVRYFGTLPAAFLRSPLRQFIHNVSLDAWGDTLAYVVGLSEVVYVATNDGAVRDSVVVPRTRRRGVPGEVRLASLRDPRAVAEETSLPWALGALGDGRLAVVFADGVIRRDALGGQLYVTLVSRDGRGACADLPIPGDGEELPRVVFDGDEMLVLEQRVVRGRAMTVVRRYDFPAGCAEPMEPVA